MSKETRDKFVSVRLRTKQEKKQFEDLKRFVGKGKTFSSNSDAVRRSIKLMVKTLEV